VYAKVFAQIYDGTLCTRGPWQALVTFQQMLVLADPDGNVDMTVGAIARRTTIPQEIIQQGIESLLLPDPESRTPTEEGRRLLPLSEGRSWGWHIVNYRHYRELKREEDRREYHREYWRNKRSKASTSSTDSTETQHAQQNQPKKETEAEAKEEAVKTKTTRKRAAPSVLVSVPDMVADGVAEQHARDWLVNRKAKGLAPLTPTIWQQTKAEAEKAGVSIAEAIGQASGNGWGGFRASWLAQQARESSSGGKQSALEGRNAQAVRQLIEKMQ
jgi:hypothetical protein